jgi:hypothetical protein
MDGGRETEGGVADEPLADLLARLEAARTALEAADGPDTAVEALTTLQETARAIAGEVERRRRILQEERADGQLDLL